jgi:hypothetical protein
MNALCALTGSPRPVARREPAGPEAASHPDETREARKRTPSQSTEFAALLALLAGTGPRVRTELLKQLPAESGNLVDRLLDGAAEEAGDDADATGDSGAAVDTMRSQAAADAMRYRGIGAAGLQDAAAVSAATASADVLHAGANMNAHDALARLAERGIASSQLMALRDEQGAETRAALDSLLDRAGTEAGVLLSTLSDSALPAAAAMAAASGASAASAANVATRRADITTPVRDPDALVPAFRSRVERVIARMKEEYGHDVSLVETTRSQERQDFLFAQGRTRPGQVVTWTQDSAHTRGEAADVMIDGSWSNADGFARLQRIAREEGLRTLGVRDPGHLELPRDARQASEMLGGAARVSARIEGTSQQSMQGSASPSPVASVAGVAGVAGVASVASAGQHGAGTSQDSPRDQGARSSRDARLLNDTRTESMEPSPMAVAFAGTTGTTMNIDAPVAVPMRSVPDGAQRATDAQDLRESVPGAINRLTMSVEGADGGERITIDLRGRSVGTHITTDAATADGLRARTGELQEALGRHGLESDTVRISSAGRAEAADAGRATASERDALKLAGAAAGSGAGSTNDGSSHGAGRERSATAREWEKQEDARRARDQEKEQDARRRGQQRHFNENP